MIAILLMIPELIRVVFAVFPPVGTAFRLIIENSFPLTEKSTKKSTTTKILKSNFHISTV